MCFAVKWRPRITNVSKGPKRDLRFTDRESPDVAQSRPSAINRPNNDIVVPSFILTGAPSIPSGSPPHWLLHRTLTIEPQNVIGISFIFNLEFRFPNLQETLFQIEFRDSKTTRFEFLAISYRDRNAIERMFGRLKDPSAALATRHDRSATNFLAAVCHLLVMSQGTNSRRTARREQHFFRSHLAASSWAPSR